MNSRNPNNHLYFKEALIGNIQTCSHHSNHRINGHRHRLRHFGTLCCFNEVKFIVKYTKKILMP
jgi:hypothetical protein